MPSLPHQTSLPSRARVHVEQRKAQRFLKAPKTNLSLILSLLLLSLSCRRWLGLGAAPQHHPTGWWPPAGSTRAIWQPKASNQQCLPSLQVYRESHWCRWLRKEKGKQQRSQLNTHMESAGRVTSVSGALDLQGGFYWDEEEWIGGWRLRYHKVFKLCLSPVSVSVGSLAYFLALDFVSDSDSPAVWKPHSSLTAKPSASFLLLILCQYTKGFPRTCKAVPGLLWQALIYWGGGGWGKEWGGAVQEGLPACATVTVSSPAWHEPLPWLQNFPLSFPGCKTSPCPSPSALGQALDPFSSTSFPSLCFEDPLLSNSLSTGTANVISPYRDLFLGITLGYDLHQKVLTTAAALRMLFHRDEQHSLNPALVDEFPKTVHN